MVKGLEIFRTAFQELTDHYVVIGGTACDILLGRGGLRPRATKDIDIILVTEAPVVLPTRSCRGFNIRRNGFNNA